MRRISFNWINQYIVDTEYVEQFLQSKHLNIVDGVVWLQAINTSIATFDRNLPK